MDYEIRREQLAVMGGTTEIGSNFSDITPSNLRYGQSSEYGTNNSTSQQVYQRYHVGFIHSPRIVKLPSSADGILASISGVLHAPTMQCNGLLLPSEPRPGPKYFRYIDWKYEAARVRPRAAANFLSISHQV